jgi:hypothetical protein
LRKGLDYLTAIREERLRNIAYSKKEFSMKDIIDKALMRSKKSNK